MRWPRTTTHDWTSLVDTAHLSDIRRRPESFVPGGATPLLREGAPYAAEEVAEAGSGTCRVTLQGDGSIPAADDGRGTDTRLDDRGQPVRKPVMSTPDL